MFNSKRHLGSCQLFSGPCRLYYFDDNANNVWKPEWHSFSRTPSSHNSNNILRIKCSTRIKIFDIWVGLIIGLISACLANVLLVLLRQRVIPLELYGKGLTFSFNRGIWAVPRPCNYIPAALGCFSKIKFHSWLWACLIARVSRDNISL